MTDLLPLWAIISAVAFVVALTTTNGTDEPRSLRIILAVLFALFWPVMFAVWMLCIIRDTFERS